VALARERSPGALPHHRRMLESDLDAVVAVENSAYMFPWSIGIFRDCLRVGYVCRVVDGPNGTGDVAGYGIMSMGAGEAHILNLCVRADLRGSGIARGLMKGLMSAARASGQGWVFLEVRPSNLPAIHLYESLGFTRVGVRQGYYQAVGGREDAAVYRLDLIGWQAGG
jgi:[ribosomal protein S18]-alanine N-acetyltransferase